jgi:hypothetical protein
MSSGFQLEVDMPHSGYEPPIHKPRKLKTTQDPAGETHSSQEEENPSHYERHLDQEEHPDPKALHPSSSERVSSSSLVHYSSPPIKQGENQEENIKENSIAPAPSQRIGGMLEQGEGNIRDDQLPHDPMLLKWKYKQASVTDEPVTANPGRAGEQTEDLAGLGAAHTEEHQEESDTEAEESEEELNTMGEVASEPGPLL